MSTATAPRQKAEKVEIRETLRPAARIAVWSMAVVAITATSVLLALLQPTVLVVIIATVVASLACTRWEWALPLLICTSSLDVAYVPGQPSLVQLVKGASILLCVVAWWRFGIRW